MITQRMGSPVAPSSDALAAALFTTAATLTIVSAVLSIAGSVNDWPPTLVNFSLATMVVTWIAAFERRRFAKERVRRQLTDAIDEIERYLWNNP